MMHSGLLRSWVSIRFLALALCVGIVTGLGVVSFRRIIDALQGFFYGDYAFFYGDYAMQIGQNNAGHLARAADGFGAPWWLIVLLPIIGGGVIGLLLWAFSKDGRVQSVAHVIKGAAVSKGRLSDSRGGVASVFISLITLSMGGSTGREGPAVHLGALLSSKLAKWMDADGITGRNLLGCAVAAAVAASFNAPIAGALFALEVILRHFAVQSFAPITLSAVAGAVVGRLSFGDVTEFILPARNSYFYTELPAFILLGIVCGLIAVVFMKSIFWVDQWGDRLQARLKIPNPMRPMIAGALLGGLAVFFPHIIGVGYATTSNALLGNFAFETAVIYAVIKVAAVAITLGGRMGGGIFSPSLMLGALTGLAFALVAGSFAPAMQGDETLYVLAGMGALAGATLGAPISSSLIIIELTGDWQAGFAVLITVSLSSLMTSHLIERSFFLTQLARTGLHLASGPQRYLLEILSVESVMRPIGAFSEKQQARFAKMHAKGKSLPQSATLDMAMLTFSGNKEKPIVIVSEDGQAILGIAHYRDALNAYNKELAQLAQEEHS